VNRIELGEYLVVDPKVCHGQLTFKGTRIPVETVLTFLSMGYTIEDVRFAHRRFRLTVLQDWKRLKRESVEEAIAFAAKLVSERFQGEIVAQLMPLHALRRQVRLTTPHTHQLSAHFVDSPPLMGGVRGG
jgi:uncharacterized protein (DUF433 family)